MQRLHLENSALSNWIAAAFTALSPLEAIGLALCGGALAVVFAALRPEHRLAVPLCTAGLAACSFFAASALATSHLIQ